MSVTVLMVGEEEHRRERPPGSGPRSQWAVTCSCGRMPPTYDSASRVVNAWRAHVDEEAARLGVTPVNPLEGRRPSSQRVFGGAQVRWITERFGDAMKVKAFPDEQGWRYTAHCRSCGREVCVNRVPARELAAWWEQHAATKLHASRHASRVREDEILRAIFREP